MSEREPVATRPVREAAERERRTRSAWAWICFVLALVLIWVHWSVTLRAVAGQPDATETTTTAYAFGALPYVVVDANGVALRWPGLALGLTATGIAAFLLRRLLRWIDKDPRESSSPV